MTMTKKNRKRKTYPLGQTIGGYLEWKAAAKAAKAERGRKPASA